MEQLTSSLFYVNFGALPNPINFYFVFFGLIMKLNKIQAAALERERRAMLLIYLHHTTQHSHPPTHPNTLHPHHATPPHQSVMGASYDVGDQWSRIQDALGSATTVFALLDRAPRMGVKPLLGEEVAASVSAGSGLVGFRGVVGAERVGKGESYTSISIFIFISICTLTNSPPSGS